MGKLKLYVGCALARAPQEFIDDVVRMKDDLRTSFDVIDFHGGDSENPDVYAHDMAQLEKADVMLGICDHPSFGLGAEVKEAIASGKRVFLVARSGNEISDFPTDMPTTEPLVSFHRYYKSLDEVVGLVVASLLS